MSDTVAILGRQPTLGLAELESICGADKIQPLPGAALVGIEPADFPMSRLGGTMKAAKLLTFLPFTDWEKIEAYLVMALPKHVPVIPEGKIRLGLSSYGFKVSIKRQNATGLTLKKVVKQAGRSVRVVPNVMNELNSAQVLHNQLTGPTGIELVLIKDGDQTVLAQTFAVQDIEAYAARDQARPKRDARVGMLPPKLAQIIINLADNRGGQPWGEEHQQYVQKSYGIAVLDPFCGTGVILQEALLAGYDAYGTDLDSRMVAYSKENLEWLFDKFADNLEERAYHLEVADAAQDTWQGFDTIACETYLGRPFSGPPKPSTLKEVMQDVDTIHKKFLKNVASQTKPGFRMCIAVPAWKTRSGFQHLPILDSLERLGYTRVSFAHVSSKDLLYYRDDQIVARELVVLIRK
ncbi:MAG TPA: methyltransferase domain-containing protein [Verrucomicrobiae bacterium]|nr:methyltransferase domain-containing protein [Verrucomicrobiae bacterium]